MITTEKMLGAKQIAAEMREQHGLIVSERFVRAMLRAGVPRIGYNARLTDVLIWWKANPDFAPRAKNSALRPSASPQVKTRTR